MKRIILISTILLLFTVPAYSALDLLGQGTSSFGTYNLIYDTDLDITWYDYTNYLTTWDNQMDWASALSVTFGSNTYNDWRLPTSPQECDLFNCTEMEMGHLYYTELGNVADSSVPYEGLQNTGDFQNLQPVTYWSGTESLDTPTNAFAFYIYNGSYGSNAKDGHHDTYAMAVMSGKAIVPEPISSILFLTGGGVLAGRRYFRKKEIE